MSSHNSSIATSLEEESGHKQNGSVTSPSENNNSSIHTILDPTSLVSVTIGLPDGQLIENYKCRASTSFGEILKQICSQCDLPLSEYVLIADNEEEEAVTYVEGMECRPNNLVGLSKKRRFIIYPRDLLVKNPYSYKAMREKKQSVTKVEMTNRVLVHLPQQKRVVVRISLKESVKSVFDQVCTEKQLYPPDYVVCHPDTREPLDMQRSLADYNIMELLIEKISGPCESQTLPKRSTSGAKAMLPSRLKAKSASKATGINQFNDVRHERVASYHGSSLSLAARGTHGESRSGKKQSKINAFLTFLRIKKKKKKKDSVDAGSQENIGVSPSLPTSRERPKFLSEGRPVSAFIPPTSSQEETSVHRQAHRPKKRRAPQPPGRPVTAGDDQLGIQAAGFSQSVPALPTLVAVELDLHHEPGDDAKEEVDVRPEVKDEDVVVAAVNAELKEVPVAEKKHHSSHDTGFHSSGSNEVDLSIEKSSQNQRKRKIPAPPRPPTPPGSEDPPRAPPHFVAPPPPVDPPPADVPIHLKPYHEDKAVNATVLDESPEEEMAPGFALSPGSANGLHKEEMEGVEERGDFKFDEDSRKEEAVEGVDLALGDQVAEEETVNGEAIVEEEGDEQSEAVEILEERGDDGEEEKAQDSEIEKVVSDQVDEENIESEDSEIIQFRLDHNDGERREIEDSGLVKVLSDQEEEDTVEIEDSGLMKVLSDQEEEDTVEIEDSGLVKVLSDQEEEDTVEIEDSEMQVELDHEEEGEELEDPEIVLMRLDVVNKEEERESMEKEDEDGRIVPTPTVSEDLDGETQDEAETAEEEDDASGNTMSLSELELKERIDEQVAAMVDNNRKELLNDLRHFEIQEVAESLVDTVLLAAVAEVKARSEEEGLESNGAGVSPNCSDVEYHKTFVVEETENEHLQFVDHLHRDVEPVDQQDKPEEVVLMSPTSSEDGLVLRSLPDESRRRETRSRCSELAFDPQAESEEEAQLEVKLVSSPDRAALPAQLISSGFQVSARKESEAEISVTPAREAMSGSELGSDWEHIQEPSADGRLEVEVEPRVEMRVHRERGPESDEERHPDLELGLHVQPSRELSVEHQLPPFRELKSDSESTLERDTTPEPEHRLEASQGTEILSCGSAGTENDREHLDAHVGLKSMNLSTATLLESEVHTDSDLPPSDVSSAAHRSLSPAWSAGSAGAGKSIFLRAVDKRASDPAIADLEQQLSAWRDQLVSNRKRLEQSADAGSTANGAGPVGQESLMQQQIQLQQALMEQMEKNITTLKAKRSSSSEPLSSPSNGALTSSVSISSLERVTTPAHVAPRIVRQRDQHRDAAKPIFDSRVHLPGGAASNASDSLSAVSPPNSVTGQQSARAARMAARAERRSESARSDEV